MVILLISLSIFNIEFMYEWPAAIIIYDTLIIYKNYISSKWIDFVVIACFSVGLRFWFIRSLRRRPQANGLFALVTSLYWHWYSRLTLHSLIATRSVPCPCSSSLSASSLGPRILLGTRHWPSTAPHLDQACSCRPFGSCWFGWRTCLSLSALGSGSPSSSSIRVIIGSRYSASRSSDFDCWSQCRFLPRRFQIRPDLNKRSESSYSFAWRLAAAASGHSGRVAPYTPGASLVFDPLKDTVLPWYQDRTDRLGR